MADRVLYISWGTPVRGREERALEVFNEAIGLMGRMQQEGRIEGFDTILLEPNGELGGCVTIRGSREQIDAMRADEEFRRNLADSALIVENIRHIEGYANEGVAQQLALLQEAIAKVPQHA